jgi:uncharacterized repeat protein (TIGR04138 family)
VSPTDLPFWDAVDRIRLADPRFRREAYGFVMAALGATVQSLPAERLGHPERRHLSGQELLGGAVSLARREFGLMAPTVFREWGILSSADVGAIVFHLVEAGQLSARAEDRPEDFAQGPDLLRSLSEGLELDTPAPRDPGGGRAEGPPGAVNPGTPA